jgi:hypothetical protein
VNSISHISTLPRITYKDVSNVHLGVPAGFRLELSTSKDETNDMKFVGVKVRATGKSAL